MGAGIQRSRMPRLQSYLGARSNVSLAYDLLDGELIHDFDPRRQLYQAIEQGYHGLNVTHPYKQQIYSEVARPLVAGHERIGSYNTLIFADNEILGANTDYSGFIQGYSYRFGLREPGVVLLCGAGGVGRAIAFALVKLGVRKLLILDVVPAQAESLAAAIAETGTSVAVVRQEDLTDVMASVDGLVNCTALGMHGHTGSAFPVEGIARQSWAFDAVYTPLETQFLQACKASGLHCLTGFDLWLFQGIDAFNHFSEVGLEVVPEMVSTTLTWLD
ncbi:hypothetical protein [Halioxenophilus sp. WMMB6]|uniref:shikimate dehydrogenase family protein n=1 Tax=Halioxenophilus sp. WMMB6 TaxID=3073815 RepID=UPI00295E7837|nr:hypothetical protein [Halioxenophilus sp. WMMB6]